MISFNRLPKAIERDHYLRQLASEFSLSLDVLKQELLRLHREMQRNEGKNEKTTSPSLKRASIQPKKLLPAFHNAEKILLAHMLKDINIAATVQEKIGGNFNVDEYQALVAHLYRFYNDGHEPNLSAFIQRLEDKKLVKIASEIAMMTTRDFLSEQELNDYIKQIVTYPKLQEVEKKELERKEAEAREDYQLAAKIAMDIIKMKKEIKH